MNNYLSEVMGRLSIGGLIALLVLLVVCYVIASVRQSIAGEGAAKSGGKKAKVECFVCPSCGHEVPLK